MEFSRDLLSDPFFLEESKFEIKELELGKKIKQSTF